MAGLDSAGLAHGLARGGGPRRLLRSRASLVVVTCLSVSGLGRVAPANALQGELRVQVIGVHDTAVDAGTVEVTSTGGLLPPILLTIPPSVGPPFVSQTLPAATYDIIYTPPLCHRLMQGTPGSVRVEIMDGQNTNVTFLVDAFTDPSGFRQSRDEPLCRPVASVSLDPDVFVIGEGGAYEIQAQMFDEASNALSFRDVSLWQSNNTAYAGITPLPDARRLTRDARALVRGVSAGTAIISATSEGQTGTASVTVAAGPQIEWTALVSGTIQDLHDVWGASSADVFAVGAAATILHYDGAIWNSQSTPVSADLRGVWGTGPNDVFAVGAGGTILHYDVSGWVQQESGTGVRLNAVWGRASSDVFAVGESNTILHFDGAGWSQLPLSGSHDFQHVWGSGPNVLVTGVEAPAVPGDPHPGIVLRGQPNAGGWTWLLMTPGSGGYSLTFPDTLHATWGTSTDFVHVVGNGGLRVHSPDGGETWETLGTGTFSLRDVLGFSASDLVAVGGQDPALGAASGLLAQYDGSVWSLQFTDVGGVTAMLNGVWGISIDDGFAVGDAGTILRIGEEDRILAAHTPLNDPTIALVDGELTDGTCLIDAVHEFQDEVSLGRLHVACPEIPGETAVFSVDKAMGLRSVTWTTAFDEVDETTLPPMLNIPTKVWIAVDGEDLEGSTTMADVIDTANDDLGRANTILTDNRAGVQLDAMGVGPQVLNFTPIGDLDPSCGALNLLGFTAPSGLVPDFSELVLHIIYMHDLPYSLLGYSCLASENEAREAAVFLVSWALADGSTLAHEAAHIMGLVSPTYGHTYHTSFTAGFPASNLMKSSGLVNRNHLSLGQVFRMNAEPMSWVNSAVSDPTNPTPALVRQNTEQRECQCDPYVKVPCPRLSQDILGVDLGDHDPYDPSLYRSVCLDVVQLVGSNEAEPTAGLLRGRYGHNDQCTADELGSPSPGLGRMRLFFPNLGPPFDCNSWIALFFRDHAPQWVNIPPNSWDYGEGNGLWIEVATNGGVCAIPDFPCVISHYQDPQDVTVHLWWKTPDLESVAKDDWQFLNARFHGLAFTGITFTLGSEGLALAGPGTDLCSPLPTTSEALGQEINVYYVSAGDVSVGTHGGHSACTGGSAFVVTVTGEASSANALVHHLGHTLGLDDISASAALGPGNVMWHQPQPAIIVPEPHLTLGQIFRMHFHPTSWIQIQRPGDPIDCDATVGRCPDLAADATN